MLLHFHSVLSVVFKNMKRNAKSFEKKFENLKKKKKSFFLCYRAGVKLLAHSFPAPRTPFLAGQACRGPFRARCVARCVAFFFLWPVEPACQVLPPEPDSASPSPRTNPTPCRAVHRPRGRLASSEYKGKTRAASGTLSATLVTPRAATNPKP
jgi:hypothetical protein